MSTFDDISKKLGLGNNPKDNFDLDNWIGEFEEGFPLYTKHSDFFRSHYWGSTVDSRPKIVELNFEPDAQQEQGYRVVEFYPNRQVETEVYMLFGTPSEIRIQISTIMNMYLMFKHKKLEQSSNNDERDYGRGGAKEGIWIRVHLCTRRTPPFYKVENKFFSKSYVSIPNVDKTKLTYQNIRSACNGSVGQNWGEYSARAWVALESEDSIVRQMVAGGSTEEHAENNLKKFLTFSQCKLLDMVTKKVLFDEGTRALDPDKNQYNSYDMYPSFIEVTHTKIVPINQQSKKGRKTIKGRQLRKYEKLPIYSMSEPSYFSGSLNNVISSSFN